MIVDGVLYPLKALERVTKGKDGFYWPTPRANKIGGYSSPRFRPTLEQTVKMQLIQGSSALGRLNPVWIEWLMGYPLQWTDLDHWAMQWFQCKRKKRSKF